MIRNNNAQNLVCSPSKKIDTGSQEGVSIPDKGSQEKRKGIRIGKTHQNVRCCVRYKRESDRGGRRSASDTLDVTREHSW